MVSKCVCANLVGGEIRPNVVGCEKWWAGVQKMQFQPWTSGRIGKMWLIQENTNVVHCSKCSVITCGFFVCLIVNTGGGGHLYCLHILCCKSYQGEPIFS